MKKFPNVIIPVYHGDHVRAVLNEAKRLGYTVDSECLALRHHQRYDRIQTIHLDGNGVVFAYMHFTDLELLHSSEYMLNTAKLITKLRKLRALDQALNTTNSQDNFATLSVVPRRTYEVVSTRLTADSTGSMCHVSAYVPPVTDTPWERPKASNPIVDWVVYKTLQAVAVVKRAVLAFTKHIK